MDNKINPLFKLAAVNMLMTRALQGALNAQSESVKLIATEIEKVSGLNVKVQSYRKNGTSINEVQDFGKDNKDAKEMLDQMLLYKVDKKDIQSMYDNLSKNERVKISDATIQKIEAQLSAYIQSLNTRNSQDQLTLQTLTSRYTQAGEQASAVLQKDAQTKSTIINNSRGLA